MVLSLDKGVDRGKRKGKMKDGDFGMLYTLSGHLDHISHPYCLVIIGVLFYKVTKSRIGKVLKM